MSHNFAVLANRVGFLVEEDNEERGVMLFIDPSNAEVRRFFSPRLLRRGGSIFAYGSVGIALKRVDDEERYDEIWFDTQNVESLQVVHAEVGSKELTLRFLERIREYLENLPGSVAELRKSANISGHWINRYLTKFTDQHILDFKDTLAKYK